ncbi:HlyD family secretion protein [Sphingomonas sp. PP-CC-3G-468]|uniref:HlyD family secretion protein n=1 Tax=Sphingomonas sp. PP-CC-3G-468 TaxID=2135656 RepID=UPI00104DD66F|nr:HlyD family secretion protein [Sphingomonas sp. PP-CC-3G-468]TCM07440.1 membrane fusion protein (multidrug efflux system) [Sphingomonas sp. PP-CC-3G-468]
MSGEEGRRTAVDEHQGEVRPRSDADEACEAVSGNSAADDAEGERSSVDGGREGTDGNQKRSLFRRPIFWVVLVVVGAIIVGGTFYWLDARRFESTDDAFVDAHIVRIAPTVGGMLVAVADVDNRHVEAGRLLAVVQPNGPQAQLAEAQANVRQAQAEYRRSLASITAAEATRDQTAAQAKQPLADAIKAQQDLARYYALLRLDRAAVAQQQVDQARATSRSTAAQAEAARRQIDNADAQVVVARRAAAAAQAVIGARRAAVDQAQVTIGDLSLRAPVSGQVTNRQVNLGSYVGPGAQLMAIVPDRLWITANFKETQLQLMRIGQPVEIKVDAFPDVAFHGHVDSFQRGAGQAFALLPPQNATGNYVKVVQRVPVRIVFDRADGAADIHRFPIGPGMSVVPTVKVR